MSMDYRLTWKAERGYWRPQSGFLSDEECDWWERLKAEHAEILAAALPRSEDSWRRLFGLLPPASSKSRVDKEEVRVRVDMADLAGQYGVRLRAYGRRASARCPFHEDRLASMSLDLDRKLWHCFSGCGGGDCFSLVMRLEDCSFIEAVKILNRMY